MTNRDEVTERIQQRNRYLRAFYELTKDEPLRWSTHREIATRAGIADDQIMPVSQDLANGGLVKLRTMGGIDGYVELTGKGVEAAEALILNEDPQLAATPEVANLENIHNSDREWVLRYLPLVQIAFDAFTRDGTWPEIEPMQRALDRRELDIDVQKAVQELPRGPGEVRAVFPMNVFMPIRVLKFLPEAGPVLAVCLELVQRAVHVYFSDSDDLQIASNDPWFALSQSGELPSVAVRLLMGDSPSPFAGGGYGPDGSWRLAINGTMTRRFADVSSIDEYVDRQLELRQESQAQLAALGGGPRLSEVWVGTGEAARLQDGGEDLSNQHGWRVFVVMPFAESWSDGIYDFIRRAARSLGIEDDRIIRADKISNPGRIDQQILQAITNADVVVGDISGANPNVMWELGYAEAALIPCVILNQRVDESPFDLANTRQVSYRLAPTDDDERNLAKHIMSAIEDGSGEG